MLLLLSNHDALSQTTIYGSVRDHKEYLYAASIVLKDSLSKRIISYTYSDINGNYELKINQRGQFNLVFTSLGYEVKTMPVVLKPDQQEMKIEVILAEESMNLDEVVIKAELPMTLKEDTISFKTKFYTKGTEQTVEELLKKIPGVDVRTDGTVTIGNQEVEKLMVDGDDLFDKGYKILSKNMPAYPVEEVEILKRYSNNRLLKGVEESEKVALNLKLNEKTQHIWFGDVETSTGIDDFYQFKSNLMNFGKKNKYFFLTDLNTIGYDATGDIENLIRPFRINEPASIGDNQKISPMLNLLADPLNFKRSRTHFNNAELASLNAIFKPSEKLKIKTLVFFNSDEMDFFRNSSETVAVGSTNFTNSTDYQLQNKKRVAFGKLDLVYNLSKTKMVEAFLKYNRGNFNDRSNLIFNQSETTENLQHQNTLFDQKISYSNKFKERKVFLLTGRFIDEKTPQRYHLNQFFFQELFPSFENIDRVEQQSTNQMQFAGLNTHLLDRRVKGHLLEFQLGSEFRKDKLLTTLSFLKGNAVRETPKGYQNRTSYQVHDLYLKGKYRLKISRFGVVWKLHIHQLFNRLQNNGVSKSQNPFFVNPSMGFDWKINSKNKIISSYSYNTTNAEVTDVYSDFLLTGFRTFSKGTGTFRQLDASSFVSSYQLGNWSDRFFASTFVIYRKNHDFFSTNRRLQQNVIQSNKLLIKDRKFLSVSSSLDYYFRLIASNLKLNLGHSTTEFKNSVNNSDLRWIRSSTYKYGFEMRSGFSGIFNYHIGSEWSVSEMATTATSSFTNTMSFLDVSLVFSKVFDFQLQSERYHFGNLQNNRAYYFMDANARYQLIEDQLTLGLSGRNLLNVRAFTNFSISDIGTSTTEYRLLERIVLLTLEYRF